VSVVVYKDGVMAADSRAYSGGSHPIGTKKKIHRLTDGSLLGITSNQIGLPEAVRDWIDQGARRDALLPDQPSFTAIHVLTNGEIYFYDDSYVPSGPITTSEITIGSGMKYALGALKMGATAYEAVEVAKQCDFYCGGKVAILTLKGDQ
jgi:ATP-dependent protease HslVU (ClpYQ) peptidase subunit